MGAPGPALPQPEFWQEGNRSTQCPAADQKNAIFALTKIVLNHSILNSLLLYLPLHYPELGHTNNYAMEDK